MLVPFNIVPTHIVLFPNDRRFKADQFLSAVTSAITFTKSTDSKCVPFSTDFKEKKKTV